MDRPPPSMLRAAQVGFEVMEFVHHCCVTIPAGLVQWRVVEEIGMIAGAGMA